MDYVVASALLVACGVATCVVLLRLRDHWHDRRVCAAAKHNAVLADLLDRLETRPSMRVRRSLARRQILDDAERLDRWVRKSGGVDEAGVPREPFPDTRLVDRYLLQVRRGSDEVNRAVAAGLLGWTARPEIVAPLLATAEFATGRAPLLRLTATSSLGMVRHRAALGVLVEALEAPEKNMDEAIIRALTRCGPAAVEPVAAVLGDTTRPAAMRCRCARALGAIAAPESTPPLVAALRDANAEIRAQASEALAARSDPAACDRLLPLLLTEPVPMVRLTMARAAAVLAPGRTLQYLARGLSDLRAGVRVRVVEALEQVGNAARDLLVVSLTDPDEEVAHAAARGLDGIGAIAEAIDRLASQGYDAEASEFLIAVGRAGHLDPLIDALDRRRPSALPQIVRVLARVGDPRAGNPLAALLDHVDNDALRARIVEALRRTGDGGHTGRIERLLAARDEWVRKSAVDYLARFADPTVTDRVLPLLADPNPWARSSVLRVLEALAPHGIDVRNVQPLLADPYDFVRAQAVRTLCAARAFEVLLETDVMDHIAEERVRSALLRGLGDHATPAAMPLITRLAAFCADADLDLLRHAARRAVSALEPEEIDLLLLGNAHPEQESSARWFAAIAWPRATQNAAASWRDELLDDPDPRVRAALVAALADRDEDRADLIIAVHRALEDPAPTVVRAALCTCARLGLHELESAASDALGHEDESVRVDAILVQALLPGGADRVDALARADHSRAQRVAATAARLLVNDPAAVLDWIALLRLGSDRRILERWILGEHALFSHVRHLIEDDSARVCSAILLCRSAFEAEEHLASVLATHPREIERTLALRALIDVGRDRCVGSIRSALYQDPSPAIRADALAHLVERDPSGRRREFLEYALASDEEELRLRAIRLCAMLPGTLASEMLATALGRGSAAERAAVIERLAALLQERGEEVLDFVLHPRLSGEALVDLCRVMDFCALPVCVDVLRSQFGHPDPLVRAAAVGPLLRRLRGGGHETLARGIADPVAKVRARTLQAVSAFGREDLPLDPEQVRAALRLAHTDSDPEVRSRTALAVARLHIDGTGGILGTLERDADPRVERIAREARKEYEARRHPDPVS